jgi:hypothetical protein
VLLGFAAMGALVSGFIVSAAEEVAGADTVDALFDVPAPDSVPGFECIEQDFGSAECQVEGGYMSIFMEGTASAGWSATNLLVYAD